MSTQYPGGIIIANPTQPTTSSASGVWTANQAENYAKQGIWPRSPGAPTIGTASISTGSTTASVAYTAPTDAGTGAVTYTATSSPGGLTGTGASPISVSGLTVGTAYTFTVAGTTPGGTGPSSAASNSITPTAVTGQQAYTSSGTYSWVAPSGVTSVSVVAVGGGNSGCNYGGGGGGGGLGYKNTYAVTAGSSYTVVVGTGQRNPVGCSVAADSYFVSTAVVKGGAGVNATGGTYTGDGGGNGGPRGTNNVCCAGQSGGGGAGGYSGNGGKGISNPGASGRTAGSGGGGGGGGATYGGGGVGLLGQGANGSIATVAGGGGSCGGNGKEANGVCISGGLYGGGSGGGSGGSQKGSTGAVRIIWPGNTRTFPSTNTGNL